jgi:hypothetical protein
MVLAVTGGVDGGTGAGLLTIKGAACLAPAEAGAAGGCVFERAAAAGAGEPFDGALVAGFDMGTGFFAGTDTVLEGTDTVLEGTDTVLEDTDLADTDAVFLAGATFFGTGLAIFLDIGPFLANLLPPDEWAGLVAAFLAGTIFLTLIGFLAGLAAFFLVAIQLGFFSDKHF